MLPLFRWPAAPCQALPRLAVPSLLALMVVACGQEPRPAGPQDPGLSSQAIYEHPEGRFSVALPRTWQGGYRIDAVSDAAAAARQPKAQHVVTFRYVPLATATPEQALLTLCVFAPGDWASLAAESASGTVVARGDDRVVVAVLPTGNPFDPGSADARRFETMRVTDELLRSAVTLR